MNQNTAVLESMPVAQAVRKQIVPAIASQMIALIYNLADTYFVGMLNDPNETAAITIVYSSFVMLTAISVWSGRCKCPIKSARREKDGGCQKDCVNFLLGRTGMRYLVCDCIFDSGPSGPVSLRSNSGNI